MVAAYIDTLMAVPAAAPSWLSQAATKTRGADQGQLRPGARPALRTVSWAIHSAA